MNYELIALCGAWDLATIEVGVLQITTYWSLRRELEPGFLIRLGDGQRMCDFLVASILSRFFLAVSSGTSAEFVMKQIFRTTCTVEDRTEGGVDHDMRSQAYV